MLLQSHLRDQNGDYYLDILPALPTKFANGKITGIVAKGGFELSIEWKNNALKKLQVVSKIGNKLNVRYKGKIVSMKTAKGKKYTFGVGDFK